jgi:hypothetical protein
MQYLFSVIHDAPDLATADEMAAIDVLTTGSTTRATGSSPAASGCPPMPPSSTTGAGRR